MPSQKVKNPKRKYLNSKNIFTTTKQEPQYHYFNVISPTIATQPVPNVIVSIQSKSDINQSPSKNIRKVSQSEVQIIAHTRRDRVIVENQLQKLADDKTQEFKINRSRIHSRFSRNQCHHSISQATGGSPDRKNSQKGHKKSGSSVSQIKKGRSHKPSSNRLLLKRRKCILQFKDLATVTSYSNQPNQSETRSNYNMKGSISQSPEKPQLSKQSQSPDDDKYLSAAITLKQRVQSQNIQGHSIFNKILPSQVRLKSQDIGTISKKFSQSSVDSKNNEMKLFFFPRSISNNSRKYFETSKRKNSKDTCPIYSPIYSRPVANKTSSELGLSQKKPQLIKQKTKSHCNAGYKKIMNQPNISLKQRPSKLYFNFDSAIENHTIIPLQNRVQQGSSKQQVRCEHKKKSGFLTYNELAKKCTKQKRQRTQTEVIQPWQQTHSLDSKKENLFEISFSSIHQNFQVQL